MGSEMCIRDRSMTIERLEPRRGTTASITTRSGPATAPHPNPRGSRPAQAPPLGLPPVAEPDVDDLRAPTLGISELLVILRRRWRWFVGGTLVVTVLAVALSTSQSEQYQASARVLIRTSVSTDPSGEQAIAGDAFVADRQLKNEAQVLVSAALRAAVDERYDGDIDVHDVTAVPSTDGSDSIDLTASGGDPEDVTELVRTYAETYIEYSQQLRIEGITTTADGVQELVDSLGARRAEISEPLNAAQAAAAADPGNGFAQQEYAAQLGLVGPQVSQIDAQISTYLLRLQTLQLSESLVNEQQAQLVEEPEVPTDPVSPKPLRDGIIGMMFGLGIGFVLALLREFLDDSIRSVDDLERLADLELPLLGTVPSYPHADGELVAVAHPTSNASEAYRAVRTSVRLLAIDRRMRLVQITSPGAGDGKTTTTANLAASLAQAGHRVAVVSCDLRRPRLHTYYDLPMGPGLTNVLLGECALAEALQPTESGVFLLAAGARPPNPSELLGSSRTASVFEFLANEFDFVLVDSPPVLAVTDAIVISRLVDATVLVFGANGTTRKAAREAHQRLGQNGAHVVGLVLNKARLGGREGYTYQYSESS